MQKVVLGIDSLLQQAPEFKNKRLALVTNDAALTSQGILNRVALMQQGFTIVKLFSPEHGISRGGEDGATQYNHIDRITGLPVVSLYGAQLAPDAAMLQDVDAVLFDVPDIGCRFYTYLWTLTHVMEACAQHQKPLYILDRPNPTGALLEKAEGPFLDEVHCSSFIGRWNMPLKHCCTLGELARYFAARQKMALQLSVIAVQHYQRHFTAAHDFTFTPTSPAIQNFETALLYPGTGLLEGITVNEGRGTTYPFTCFGAPWINKQELWQRWQQEAAAGLAAAAITYTPDSGLYAGETCNGLQFTITDAASLQPVAAGIALLRLLMQLYPLQVQERLYKTAANPSGSNHLDKLTGVAQAFVLLQSGGNMDTAVAVEWQQLMAPFLLY